MKQTTIPLHKITQAEWLVLNELGRKANERADREDRRRGESTAFELGGPEWVLTMAVGYIIEGIKTDDMVKLAQSVDLISQAYYALFYPGLRSKR